MSYQQTHQEEPPPYAHAVKGGPGPMSVPAGSAADAVQRSHGWRDVWWAVIFWLQVLAVLITGGVCYNKYRADFRTADGSQGQNIGPLEHAWSLLAVCIGTGGLLSLLFLWLMKAHGVVMIWLSLLFTLVLSVAALILSVFAGSIVGIVLSGIGFLLTAWYVYSVRHKVPFAAAILEVALRSMSDFWTAWTIPVLGFVLMGAVSYLWAICSFSIVYAVDHGENGNSGANSARGFIFFLLVLSTFWTVLVVKGWVHTSLAGVQATWYFLAPHAVPAHPVWNAVKRASTTSFGSICFGSFLVAFIRTLRYFLQVAQNQARQNNNAAAACALCLVDCLLGCLESIVNYINRYAFAIVAIYGKPFMESASQAWGLMRSRGFDAVINDSLIGGVLNMCVLIGGLLTGIFAALLAYYSFDIDWRPWAGVGFAIGAFMMTIIQEVAESAVITLFICLADDPAALQRTKPEAYNRIMDPLNSNYPNRANMQAEMGV